MNATRPKSRAGSISIYNGEFRLFVYPSGGASLQRKVEGIGYVVDDESPIPDDIALYEAAPDLLAALADLLAWAENVPTDYEEDRLQMAARRAISKAKGE